jgi:ligand-binding sensor domain-containing protein/signal transduction histidine kinase
VCLPGARQDNAYVRLPISEGEDLLFVSMSFGQGPSHGRVGQIVEDQTGFLWFGTKDGLKRYDGYRIRDFRPDPKDPKSLSGVFINALFTDHAGKVWVAPDEHLDRYDPVTETFSHFDSRPGQLEPPVNDIRQDREGMIWLATSHGLSRMDPITGSIAHFQHKSDDPASLTNDFLRSTFEERDGTFWVAGNLALDLFDRPSGSVVQHFSLQNPLRRGERTSANESVRLLQDHAGVLWVASARDGLAMVDRKTSKLIFFALDAGTDPRVQPGAYAIHEDRYGTLWVGTNGGGLLKLNQNRTSFVRYRNRRNDPDSLSSDTVLALFEDHEDGMWIGTGGGGLLRLANQPAHFQLYRHDSSKTQSLPTDFIASVFEDRHGMVWVGSTGEVTRIDRKNARYTRYRIGAIDGPPADVTAIAEDRSGDLWFGTRGQGLSRFDPLTGRSTIYRHDSKNPHSLSHDSVFSVIVDRRGRLWAGTEDGLNAFDPKTGQFRVFKAAGANRERGIAEDAAGRLWLATWYSGVHCFDPDTGQFTVYRSSDSPRSLSNDAVAAILVDRSGMVWAGTENGLNQLDPASGTFKTYNTRDGLPNNNVNGILEDEAGNLWITTNNGLSNFDRHLNLFQNYYRSDGVLGDFTSAWRGPNGEMFFGSYTGLSVLPPGRVTGNPYVPAIVLTNFQISDKPTAIGAGSPLQQSIPLTKSLTVSHAQNTLSFEFAALSYVNPQRTRYRYRLEGLESDWNEVDSTQRFARYTTLPSRKYVFRVQSRTSRSAWSENGVGVRIQVLPPWWDTWTAWVAWVLAFCLSLWAAYRLRVGHVAGQLELRFEERLMERTRIAGELHDTLLQGFLSASMQLDVAADRLPADSPLKPQLNHILELMAGVSAEGRSALQDLRSPEGASMRLEQALAQVEQEFARRPVGSRPAFRIAVTGHALPLHPVLRDEVYRIGREAIVNAFRHSRARSIEVTIEYSRRQFRFVVHDDGRGIDPDVLRDGREDRGLSGMRDRAERIGAQFRLWSRAGLGTKIEMSVPGRIAFRPPRARDRQHHGAFHDIRQFLKIPLWPGVNTEKVVHKDSKHQ